MEQIDSIKNYDIKQLQPNVFCVNKPLGLSSYMVVDLFKKLGQFYKVGHAGTLDPLATGALIILVNNATKLSNFYLTKGKNYKFEVLFGVKTTTYDLEGRIEEYKKCVRGSASKINKAIRELVGLHEWEVGNFSALKLKGKPLYAYKKPVTKKKLMQIHTLKLEELNHITKNDLIKLCNNKKELVRENFKKYQEIMEIQLKGKPVQLQNNLIHALDSFIQFIEEHEDQKYYIGSFTADVSSGTYIRVLVEKISEKLQIPATTFAIHRECNYNK